MTLNIRNSYNEKQIQLFGPPKNFQRPAQRLPLKKAARILSYEFPTNLIWSAICSATFVGSVEQSSPLPSRRDISDKSMLELRQGDFQLPIVQLCSNRLLQQILALLRFLLEDKALIRRLT